MKRWLINAFSCAPILLLIAVLVLWGWQYFTSARHGVYLAMAPRDGRLWELRLENNACSLWTVHRWPHNAKETGILCEWTGLYWAYNAANYRKSWNAPGILIEHTTGHTEIVLSDGERREWRERYAEKYPDPGFSAALWSWRIVMQNWAVTLVLAICATPFVINTYGSWIRQRHRRDGHCPICGYDLTANISGICPECGSQVAALRRERNGVSA